MKQIKKSFARSRDLVESILNNAGTVFSKTLYLKDLFDFFDVLPTITSPADGRKFPENFCRDSFLKTSVFVIQNPKNGRFGMLIWI